MKSVQRIGRSFLAAFYGIVLTWKNEQSFRIQIGVAFALMALMVVLPLTKPEIIILTFLIMAVLVLELFNSTLERIIDALQPRIHPFAREVKDMMAGAVLLTAVTSIVVAILIFWSYVFRV